MQKIKYIALSTLFLSLGMFTSCNNSNIDVMVIGVNETNFNEIDVIIEELQNQKVQVIDNINFFSGKIGNKNVVVAQSPVGMSPSAMTTTIGIKTFNPKYVINEGTSGGHHKDIHRFDIILGKKLINIASYEGDGSNPSTWELQQDELSSDDMLLKIAGGVKYKDGKLEAGTIATTDAWNTEASYIEKINTKFGEACEEMESYAVAGVCKNYSIPYLAIRVISNNAIIPEPYEGEAPNKSCQRFAIDVIKAI